MNSSSLKTIVLLAAGALCIHATADADDVSAHAEVKFIGSSTLHDFEGTVPTKPFVADFREDAETGELHVTAKTSIEVEAMTTHNGKRDKNMFKMFDLAHFRNIEGILEDALLSEEESTQACLHLKIRNVEHDVEATLSNVVREGNCINCTMTFPVSLSFFELKAPSVMGIIKVDDTVQVECSITGQVVDKVAAR